MHWWQFAAWNALGGIVWATGIGLLAYWAGKAAGDAVGTYGLYAVGVLVVLGVIAFVVLRLWRKRVEASVVRLLTGSTRPRASCGCGGSPRR